MAKAGHYATKALIALIGLVAVYSAYPVGSFTLYVVGALVVISVAVILAYLIHRHGRALCERCVMDMPLDISAKAAKYKKRFRVAHWFQGGSLMVFYLATIVLVSFYSYTSIGKWLWVAIWISFIYMLLVYSTHQRLQPWCPYCRGGGIGDHEHRPTPELVGN